MKNKLIKILAFITIVPFIVQVINKQRTKSILRKKVLSDGTTDYAGTASNIANSIAKSRELYKELIVKIHPDRVTDEYKEKATELSSKITKSKRNYQELIELKKEVEALFEHQINSSNLK